MDYFRSQILEVEKISPRQMVGKNILFEAMQTPVAYLEVLLDRVSPYMSWPNLRSCYTIQISYTSDEPVSNSDVDRPSHRN